MMLSFKLLKLLTCPKTGNPLVYDKKSKLLINEKDILSYPVIEGVPLLLSDKARKNWGKALTAPKISPLKVFTVTI